MEPIDRIGVCHTKARAFLGKAVAGCEDCVPGSPSVAAPSISASSSASPSSSISSSPSSSISASLSGSPSSSMSASPSLAGCVCGCTGTVHWMSLDFGYDDAPVLPCKYNPGCQTIFPPVDFDGIVSDLNAASINFALDDGVNPFTPCVYVQYVDIEGRSKPDDWPDDITVSVTFRTTDCEADEIPAILIIKAYFNIPGPMEVKLFLHSTATAYNCSGTDITPANIYTSTLSGGCSETCLGDHSAYGGQVRVITY